MQTLKIHTSCSQPLAIGDGFGGVEVAAFNPLALVASLCDDLGKPKELTFMYTGDDCDARDNDQGKKAKCDGDLGPTAPVTIIYTGRHPGDISVTPSTGIAIGDPVTIKANGGRDRLPSNTKLEITNGVGTQKLEIHTSCSRPVDIGDQFGSLELIEFVSKSGVTAPSP